MDTNNKFKTPNSGEIAVRQTRYLDQAFLDVAQSETPQLIREVTIDLSEERSVENGTLFKLQYPFNTVYVSQVTDSTVNFKLIPYGNVDGITGATLRQNDVLEFDKPVLNFAIANDAQAGKSVTLQFFLYSKIKQGSTSITIDNPVKNISVGANVLSNSFPLIHLRQLVKNGALNNFSFQYSAMTQVNALNSDANNIFIVPVGFELVVTGIELYNYNAVGSTRFDVTPYVGELLVGASASANNTNVNASTYFSKFHALTNSPYIMDKAETGISIANPVMFLNVISSAKAEFTVSAGRRIACAIVNASGGVINVETSFEIVGYLREV